MLTNRNKLSFIPQHMLDMLKDEILKIFNNWFFDIEYGSDIVSIKDNFDNLLIPETHPSRDPSETFYFNDHFVWRTHCTTQTIKTLYEKPNNIPFKVVTIGHVYRNDDTDNTHLPQFNQLDALIAKENINIGDLKNFISKLLSILLPDVTYKWRKSFFPFTQPSYEIDVLCFCDKDHTCSLCKGSGWIEILGCGIIHRNIMNNAGHNNDKFRALACGFGLERLLMFKYKLKDIRQTRSINFLTLKYDCH